MATPQSNEVTILMGLYNGAAHLEAQLASIAAQSHDNWRLICRDDGSSDGTAEIVSDFAKAHPGKVDLGNGPKAGFSANYLQMLRDLPDSPGILSFADQDDIWEPDKLARGIAALGQTRQPMLYAARCWYWYPARNLRKPSPMPTRPATFRNALIENIATGNTVLLNPAAAQVARQAAQRTTAVFAHDWWLYLLMTGAGHGITFDTGAPVLRYRQHDSNVIGGGQTLMAQIKRKTKVLQGAFSDRISSNLQALEEVRDLLSPDSRAVMDAFAQARRAGVSERLRALKKVAPYRQTMLGNLGFWGAASLGRI